MPVVKLSGSRAPQRNGRVASVPKVVSKVVFDHIAFISEAEHEIVETLSGIDFHDMPENRFATDRDHRLGAELCFFTEARSLASAKNDNFHSTSFMGALVENPLWIFQKSPRF